MSLKKNIGVFDMILRLGLSLAAIYLGFIESDVITDRLSSMVIGILGLLNLVVALLRYCPLYALAGINTCKID